MGALVADQAVVPVESRATPWVVAFVRPRVRVDELVLVQMATLCVALAAAWVVTSKPSLLLDGSLHWVGCRWGWYFRHDARVSQELVAAIWRIRLEMPFVRRRSPHSGSERILAYL